MVHVDPTGVMFTRIRKEDKDQSIGKQVPPIGFTELLPEIKVENGDLVLTKHGWNAFFETGLHQELQEKKVT